MNPCRPDRRCAAAVSLSAVVFGWGALAILAQSLLLRESLVLFFGSELSWGIVLGSWLLGVAIGGGLGGVAAGRADRASRRFAVVAILFVLFVPATIWLLRGSRAWLGVGTGEYVPLAASALLSLGFIGPCGLLIGLGFPLACRLSAQASGRTAASRDPTDPEPSARPIGWVYLAESAGSLAGGAGFTFWLVGRVDPFSMFLGAGVGLLILVAGLELAHSTRRLPMVALVSVLLALVGVVAMAEGLASRLDRSAVLRRWRSFAGGFRLIASRDSRYQNIAIGSRQRQYSVFTNGQRQLDFPQVYGPYRLATHTAMCQHPAPRNVLLLGGGASGVLAEVLRHPVQRVDYVELDDVWLELVRPLLPERDRKALDDPRVHVHHVDARHYVKLTKRRYELVLADLPPPMSAMNARYYTEGFYREIRRILTPRGVLVFATEASPAELRPEAGRCLGSIFATLKRVFADVLVEWGSTPRIYACPAPGALTTDPNVLAERLLARNVHLPDLEAGIDDPSILPELYRAFFSSTDRLTPEHVAKRRRELAALADAPVNTDLKPAIFLLWLIRQDRQLHGQSARLFEWISLLRPWHVLLALAGLPAAWMAWLHWRGKGLAGVVRTAAIFSIGTTGLASMALEIVLIFAFQNLYGYVYERIGMIIAMFMFGLVIGSFAANRLLKRIGTSSGRASSAGSPIAMLRRLIVLDSLMALLAAGVPLVLAQLAGLRGPAAAIGLVEPVVFGLVLLAGVVGGAAFPLAGQVYLQQAAGIGRAAGAVEAADHAGACAGALVTGVALVPVLGLASACLLIASIKLLAVGLLLGVAVAVRRGKGTRAAMR